LSAELDKQTRRHTDLIRTLTEQRDSLTDRLGLLERQIHELGTTLAQTTARLEGETRLAQQAAAAAAAVAASNRAAQPKPDLPESPPPVMPAPAPAAVSPPTSSLGRMPAPQTANLLPPGQIHPSISPPTVGFAVTPGGTPASPPTYTGAIASPPGVADPNGTPSPVRPFPGQPQHAAAAADSWSTVLTHPNGLKAPPSSIAIPAMFRSNPLMMTGIFAMPAQAGTSAAEFGVDLGTAPTVEGLRARWNELQISQSPLLDNLKPLIALKEGPRSGQELHLVAGPLTNNSAAHRLCAVLVGTSALCQPTAYEGQRLSVR